MAQELRARAPASELNQVPSSLPV